MFDPQLDTLSCQSWHEESVEALPGYHWVGGAGGLWLKEETDVEIFCGVCLQGVHLIKQENMNIYLKTGLLDTFIWSLQAFNNQSWNWNRWLPSNSSSPL